MTRLAFLLLLVAAALAAPASALAADPQPTQPLSASTVLAPFADQPLDDARYDFARGCSRGPARGTLALAAWLEEHTSRGSLWGIYNCRKVRGSSRSWSLHAEGRALDWKLDHRSSADRRAATQLIGLLLARDGAGREAALARRMGVQEIVWNCRIWSARSPWWKRSRLCPPGRKVGVTLAHRDHIHIGLNRAGARLRTSFWRAQRP
jgi:hypothetical protein